MNSYNFLNIRCIQKKIPQVELAGKIATVHIPSFHSAIAVSNGSMHINCNF